MSISITVSYIFLPAILMQLHFVEQLPRQDSNCHNNSSSSSRSHVDHNTLYNSHLQSCGVGMINHQEPVLLQLLQQQQQRMMVAAVVAVADVVTLEQQQQQQQQTSGLLLL
jgi:hypothetical protein